ncbi:alcohol dehydrogenase GroES domain protein [Kalymmatonema gypsitolerans NIES-4073]|nr:alcohol dehydrogenase GroES domain protein [Scytonema sp. NIES-4073]
MSIVWDLLQLFDEIHTFYLSIFLHPLQIIIIFLSLYETTLLKEMTGGRGPDACIDACGMEAHGIGLEGFYDEAKQAVRLETDRPHVLRQMILACRKGGTLSVMGVYAGFVDKMPMGAFMNKGLTLKTGQMHGQKYMPRLLGHVIEGEVDPSAVFSHRLSLEDAPRGFELFKHKQDNCVKVLLKP